MDGVRYYHTTYGVWSKSAQSFGSTTVVPADPTATSLNPDTPIIVKAFGNADAHRMFSAHSEVTVLPFPWEKLPQNHVALLNRHGVTMSDTMHDAIRKIALAYSPMDLLSW